MDSSDGRTILVVNGPNLNLLGTREPATYGSATLADVERDAEAAATRHGVACRFVQSNHVGELIDAIHEARDDCSGIVINAGGYTHTSVALRDAIAAVALPTIEVHISNVHKREDFRHHSYLSAVCEAVIVGAGIHGYVLAIDHLAQRLSEQS
ncbi:type II 3-dehydroquinate dehydratase [Solicola gregarius]|uniref:3-dehydroquinate dehydratase n=1 Tax=Solicola gregarius TaxID=2908642 RepID=A0AA46TNH9_9ACTN|nr:type II 3-dehydroquinate dehydratase [Solicola gregarius]UYM07628.1 type II 3-dehydroquinate dehydratase [Solicola gregarius]